MRETLVSSRSTIHLFQTMMLNELSLHSPDQFEGFINYGQDGIQWDYLLLGLVVDNRCFSSFWTSPVEAPLLISVFLHPSICSLVTSHPKSPYHNHWPVTQLCNEVYNSRSALICKTRFSISCLLLQHNVSTKL